MSSEPLQIHESSQRLERWQTIVNLAQTARTVASKSGIEFASYVVSPRRICCQIPKTGGVIQRLRLKLCVDFWLRSGTQMHYSPGN